MCIYIYTMLSHVFLLNPLSRFVALSQSLWEVSGKIRFRPDKIKRGLNFKPGANFDNTKFDCSFLVATLELWPMFDKRHVRSSACLQGAVIV